MANICSLNLTIFNGLCYSLVSYFSNNVDNYTIMEKILFNSNPKPEKKENKSNEINDPYNYPSKDDLNKEENLIEPSGDKNPTSINEDEIINENDREVINTNFNEGFPKVNFFDFLFNETYDRRCCKIERRKLIQKCNEIVSKYYSIECVVEYLIKLENLLKDYRWNNPGLNNLENNELILDLKNLISQFNNNQIIQFD